MSLINIQSLTPRLDMLIHYIQLNDTDMCFVTETWTQHENKPKNQYIKASLDTGGYKIFTQIRQNRKGIEIAGFYKSYLHFKRLYLKENTSFKTLTVKLDITTKSYTFLISTEHNIQADNLQHVDLLRNISGPYNILHLRDFKLLWNKTKKTETQSAFMILDM